MRINASDRVRFDNGFAFSHVDETSNGQGGNLIITTNFLELLNGAQLDTSTFGRGRSGNIRIRADDSIQLDGVGDNGLSSAIFSSSWGNATGRGGNIILYTSDFRISNGAIVDARTDTHRRGGNITINADRFTALDGGQIITRISDGEAGNITLNVAEDINIAGRDQTFNRRFIRFKDQMVNEGRGESGLFANTRSRSTGDSGSILIRATDVHLENEGRIVVNSRGQGEGGAIQLQSEDLTLQGRALLSAATTNSNGGEIILNNDRLIALRDRSNITAEAGTNAAGGNGGNIRINSAFLLASPLEDSNINANAFRGNGGNIAINTQSLLGLALREEATSLSDITASSQFGSTGEIAIYTLAIDPYRELNELPTDVVDASRQIAQTCPANGEETPSEFVVTGRGGLPSDPRQTLSSETVVTRLAGLEDENSSLSSTLSPARPADGSVVPVSAAIVEAQGWVVDAEGNIMLVAQTDAVTPNAPAFNTTTCNQL